MNNLPAHPLIEDFEVFDPIEDFEVQHDGETESDNESELFPDWDAKALDDESDGKLKDAPDWDIDSDVDAELDEQKEVTYDGRVMQIFALTQDAQLILNLKSLVPREAVLKPRKVECFPNPRAGLRNALLTFGRSRSTESIVCDIIDTIDSPIADTKLIFTYLAEEKDIHDEDRAEVIFDLFGICRNILLLCSLSFALSDIEPVDKEFLDFIRDVESEYKKLYVECLVVCVGFDLMFNGIIFLRNEAIESIELDIDRMEMEVGWSFHDTGEENPYFVDKLEEYRRRRDEILEEQKSLINHFMDLYIIKKD